MGRQRFEVVRVSESGSHLMIVAVGDDCVAAVAGRDIKALQQCLTDMQYAVFEWSLRATNRLEETP